ncbi:MAG: hypothetical protein WDO14_23655 [Bacteroidota bacterium]
MKENVVNVLTNAQLPQSEGDYYLRWNVTETYMFEQTPIPNPLLGGLHHPATSMAFRIIKGWQSMLRKATT